MKECFRCHQQKPLREFYRHPMMADGRLGKCKECTKKDVTANRINNVLYYREYDSKRKSTPEATAELSRKCKKWRKRNPRKYAAQSLLNSAIKCGRVERKPCEVCGGKSHGHHENYDKPLEVTWLCAVHHSERHKEMKKEGIEP